MRSTRRNAIAIVTVTVTVTVTAACASDAGVEEVSSNAAPAATAAATSAESSVSTAADTSSPDTASSDVSLPDTTDEDPAVTSAHPAAATLLWEVQPHQVDDPRNDDDIIVTVNALTFSPDGTRLLSSGDDGTVAVLDVETGEQLVELTTANGYESIYDAAFSPDGSLVVVTGSDLYAAVFDAATGQLLRQFTGHTCCVVEHPVFTADGTAVLTVANDDRSRLWAVATGEEIRSFVHTDSPWWSTITRDGKVVALLSRELVGDDTVRLFDIGGEEIATVGAHGTTVLSAAFSDDSEWLAVGHGNGVRVVEAHTGAYVADLFAEQELVNQIDFSGDGTRVAYTGHHDIVEVWDTATWRLVSTLVGHRDFIEQVELSPDGSRVVTVSDDDTVKVWDATGGSLLATVVTAADTALAGAWPTTARFAPDGTIVVGIADGRVQRWSVD